MATNKVDAFTNPKTNIKKYKDLTLGSIATQAADAVAITGGSITGITDLALADGGTGASNASGARTALELGSIATQAANNVSITGGSITGITDLAVADGGTGASTSAAARENLDVGKTVSAITTAGAIDTAADYVAIEGPAGGTYAVTLAAPSRGGRYMVIHMTSVSGGGTVTLALTEIVGGTAATTATFDAVGETLILMSNSLKWVVLKEHGVTLS